MSVRWLYPFVLVAWSSAGIATAYAGRIGNLLTGWMGWTASAVENPANHEIYAGLLVCRTLLGLFESGQWPCALITTQRILSNQDRSFGNSILQSGASIGAIFTPFVVQLTMTDAPGSGAFHSSSWVGSVCCGCFPGLSWSRQAIWPSHPIQSRLPRLMNQRQIPRQRCAATWS